ncbi:hypothetical protein F4779DRAFT_637250 [Xylariaceae sp. FL0662B]|nr:hypothetical protein F4779DRAFT_637250 [Xylariaceae sp. FL0662B]
MGVLSTKLARYLAVWVLLAVQASSQGFLTGGCQMNWEYNDGNAQTYCNDHVCNWMFETSLSLDLCIANVDGVLTAQKYGEFRQTCSDCVITSRWNTFTCTCEKEDGTTNISDINLTDVLYNWFGFLSCFDIHQEVYPHGFPCKDPGWRPDPLAADTTCIDGCAEVLPPSSWLALGMSIANASVGDESVIYRSGPRVG